MKCDYSKSMDLMPGHDGNVADIQREFNEMTWESFTHQDALTLGLDIAQRIEDAPWPMATAVYFGEQNVFRYACEGTSERNDNFIRGKRNTVMKFREPSFLVGQRFAEKGLNFYEETGLSEDDYFCFGGGYPIFVGDEIVATVFTSGAPHVEDHRIIVEALKELKGS